MTQGLGEKRIEDLGFEEEKARRYNAKAGKM